MRGGFTVLEVVVSMALFGLLILAVSALYIFGLKSASRSYRELDELATMQALSALLTGDLEPGCARGLSVAPSGDILSVLSAASPDQLLEVDAGGRPLWQKYVLYVYGNDSGEVRRTETPLTTPFSDGPVPLETQLGQSLQVAASLAPRSRLVAQHVTLFEAERVSFRLVAVRLRMQKPNKPVRTFECSWRLHN